MLYMFCRVHCPVGSYRAKALQGRGRSYKQGIVGVKGFAQGFRIS